MVQTFTIIFHVVMVILNAVIMAIDAIYFYPLHRDDNSMAGLVSPTNVENDAVQRAFCKVKYDFIAMDRFFWTHITVTP